ncbi:MAG: aminotransferase class IV [Burkholderiaceae bacterium]|nr:aminotransferase class IV [Microbacteriaceae bacterium]
MSSPPQSPHSTWTSTWTWDGGRLEPTPSDAPSFGAVAVADSWLVDEGSVLALDLHRSRFLGAISGAGPRDDPAAFWDAAVALLPRCGVWFPRVELRVAADGAPRLAYLSRPAPARTTSVRLATHHGPDPRTVPRTKGPDLTRLLAVRELAVDRGADEAVICSTDGFVIEGAYSSLVWWRGDSLCVPDAGLDRVDSVTAATLVTVATALGVEVLHEAVTPDGLDGLEVWALSALHGIRIVTAWVDGPATAELPGRLHRWRNRLGRLSRPLGTLDG